MRMLLNVIEKKWMNAPYFQGHNRKYFLRGQSHFSWFFSRRQMLFPGRKFPFWYTQNKFSHFEKWKEKKKERKKKKPSPHFGTFPLPFPIFHLPFYNFPSFLLHFPPPPPFSIFPCLFFPGRSAEEVSGGALFPLPPSACYATAFQHLFVGGSLILMGA